MHVGRASASGSQRQMVTAGMPIQVATHVTCMVISCARTARSKSEHASYLGSALRTTAGMEAIDTRGLWRVSNLNWSFTLLTISAGDGGSYPECHVAQYPLEMGRKKARIIVFCWLALLCQLLLQASSGNTLALQVDSEGNVRYDVLVHQGNGQRPGKSQFTDTVPDRPSEEDVQATADKTRAALEKLVNGKIKAAQPKNVPDSQGATSFIRYTPGQQNGEAGLKQRIIKMTEIVEDPLEPPRFKHKKIPRGPPSPPPPVLRSPPRKATAAEQKEWMVPPCISNWKNNKGFTIPLDKRLAADGRGLQDVSTALHFRVKVG
jgi:SNW domain-containing protein 1